MNKILQKLTYGEYIVTSRKPAEEMSTRDSDWLAAGTCNWVTQTSFDPPKLAIALNLYSDLHETIEKSRKLALHILARDQENLAKKFSKDTQIKDDKIFGMDYKLVNEVPILENTIAALECSIVDEHRTGDHTLYIAQVDSAQMFNDDQELGTNQTALQYKEEDMIKDV